MKSQLQNAHNIVITSHQSPDGDAIGSSLALYHYLCLKQKNVTVIIPDAIPAYLHWMHGVNEILIYENNVAISNQLLDEAAIIFSLDYNDLSRVGAMGKIIENSNAYKIMIDHHLSPKNFANYTLSQTEASSTAQLIYDYITLLGDEPLIDSTIGEGIYTGILTDTGSFRFPSVDPQTHIIAAKLLKLGLNHARIHENIHDTNTLERLSFLGFTLNKRLKVLPNTPVAIIAITKDDSSHFKIEKGDTEGLVNWALSIKGVKMAIFAREDKDKIKISFRSKGDIAVNQFSELHFEGGGHKNAAGGVSYLTLEQTIEKIEKEVYEFIQKSTL